MNVSGTASITTDATFQILGSDGATFAAINFNGGSYDAGGTFLAMIDGNGTITFNSATAHADVLKAGVFGANGVLNIDGGTLSADTTLKLYAPGSNGQLNFVSSVTLGGTGAKILAANSVTILPSVVVFIGGSTPADVYTNHANYSNFGGTVPTNGIFAGAGASLPQALSSAPAFDDPPPPATLTTTSGTTSTTIKSPTLSTASSTTTAAVKSTTSGTTSTKVSSTTLSSGTTSTKPASATIDVRNTSELLSLLDGAAPDSNGKVTISGSKSASNVKNLTGTNINSLSRGERRILTHQMRDRSAARVGGRRIL
jgi:hypothetical protein